jgi:hypothetical protein
MSEEEIIKTININLDKIKSLCTDDCINKTVVINPLEYTLKCLLDLYNKEKGKRKDLEDRLFIEIEKNNNILIETLNIKDKIREKIKYYEQKKKDLLELPDDCAKMIASEDCDEKLYIYKELLEE